MDLLVLAASVAAWRLSDGEISSIEYPRDKQSTEKERIESSRESWRLLLLLLLWVAPS